MKLLLTSNGFTPPIEKSFLELLQKPPQENSVAFITTAAYGEEDGPEWNTPIWLETYRNQLRDLGITKIEDIDLRNKTPEELEKITSNKDIIFVNGGNTYYLMHWVKQSGFDKVVEQFVNQNKLYVGVSAGSIIMCPTIEPALWDPPDKNNVDLKDLSALNFVNFLIHPHFYPEQKVTLEQEIKGTSYPVIALTNDQALLVKDDKIELIGPNEQYFFNGFNEKM